MTRKKIALGQMRALTHMVKDVELASLRQAAAARQATLAKIEALRTPPAMIGDDLGAAGAMAMLRYQVWAEGRRSDLVTILAAQTARWLEARDQAANAFGKAQAVDDLAQQQAAESAAKKRR